MIPAHLDDFWSEPRLATLGTVRPDGSPHLVPVKCVRSGTEFWVLTRPSTVKARNLAHHPRASLAEARFKVAPGEAQLWATVEGPAHLDDDPGLLERTRAAYAERFGGLDTWGTCVLVVEVDRLLHGS